jgi:hypothetical protein
LKSSKRISQWLPIAFRLKFRLLIESTGTWWGPDAHPPCTLCSPHWILFFLALYRLVGIAFSGKISLIIPSPSSPASTLGCPLSPVAHCAYLSIFSLDFLVYVPHWTGSNLTDRESTFCP